jgi:hypothetical protein
MPMLSDLPPRFFCDFTVPSARDGITASDEYKEYLHWLADYLHQAELPLSQDQQDWLQQTGRSPRGVIFACSDSYGFGASDLEFVESYFTPDETYSQWRARIREEWEDFYPTPEDREENPFNEWQRLSEEVYARLHREWQQGKETGHEWQSVDIPFRSLLSWSLRQLPGHEERFKELDFYFENFHEASSK